MNKKTLIKVVSTIIICFTIIIALTFAINNIFKHEEPLVYVTRTGEKYHSSSCGYLWASSIPKGLNVAKKAGYTACSRCGGKASGTIIINNYEASFCISVLIMCAFVFLGFKIYNKIVISAEKQNNNLIPTNNSTQTLSNQNTQQISTSTNIIMPPKSSIIVKCGDIVTHKSFGKGKVIELSENYIKIQFVDKARKFVFPNAFIEGFLKKQNTN